MFGATGFVGRLTARYLAQAAAGARIGLAGRSPQRLQVIRDELGAAAGHWPILIADAADPATLAELAARTTVVLSTVGPYSRYGLPLVGACAAAGTDYLDLAGEPMFIRDSIDRYHKQAADTGARILHACGFDSIPSDLTVYALYRRAAQDGTGQLLDTDLVVRDFAGGFSGGTIASIVEVLRTASADPQARRLINDPYTLTPDRPAEPELGEQPDLPWRRGSNIAPELAGIWTGGFPMATVNTRVVRRSNAELDWAYGRRFRYTEQMSVGSSAAAPVLAAALSAIGNTMLHLGGRYFRLAPHRLVEAIVPAPGTGPIETTRRTGHYRVETYTTTTDGARYRAVMAQRGDPGYQATSVLLGECGLSLVWDREALPDRCGVLTPAAALGDALLTRLPGAGVTLEVERLG